MYLIFLVCKFGGGQYFEGELMKRKMIYSDRYPRCWLKHCSNGQTKTTPMECGMSCKQSSCSINYTFEVTLIRGIIWFFSISSHFFLSAVLTFQYPFALVDGIIYF